MDQAVDNEPSGSPSDPASAGLIQALQDRIAEQEESLQARAERIRQLEEIIKTFQRKIFAASSEQVPADQLGLFNEAEEIIEAPAKETPVERQPRAARRGRPALPAELPREEVIYDLEEADKVCPHDGAALTPIGEETSEQLEIIPAQVKVIRHIQRKYACPCCEQHVATASKPAQPLGKSMAGPGLLAYVATAKYADALPLYRQTQIFDRLGVSLDRTTLANWMVGCGELTQPLINRLTELILEQPVVEMDESPVQVLEEPGKTAQSQSYMWVMGAGPPGARNVIYHYSPTRSREVPRALLTDYAGALMVDGYEGYGGLEPAVTRLGCWAHARRKFFDAKKLQPKGKTGRADLALAYIGKLYGIERQAKDLDSTARHALRQQQAVPVIREFRAWLDKTLPKVPPKNQLGKALHYLAGQWSRLVRYLEDGRYPIDNNAIENAIRPFAIGRKNWLFSKSQAGAKASANLYSLIETAKAHGLEPYAYLRHIFKQLPLATSVDDIDALLPSAVKGGGL